MTKTACANKDPNKVCCTVVSYAELCRYMTQVAAVIEHLIDTDIFISHNRKMRELDEFEIRFINSDEAKRLLRLQVDRANIRLWFQDPGAEITCAAWDSVKTEMAEAAPLFEAYFKHDSDMLRGAYKASLTCKLTDAILKMSSAVEDVRRNRTRTCR